MKIDWADEVLAKTALTHEGKLCDAVVSPDQKAPPPGGKTRVKAPKHDTKVA